MSPEPLNKLTLSSQTQDEDDMGDWELDDNLKNSRKKRRARNTAHNKRNTQ